MIKFKKITNKYNKYFIFMSNDKKSKSKPELYNDLHPESSLKKLVLRIEKQH